jgi:Putative transposase
LRLTQDGRIVLELKTAWADDTGHLLFEPPDLLARLAAIVPRPRVNLILYHVCSPGTLAGGPLW